MFIIYFFSRHTSIEPFKIKSVEPIFFTTKEQRLNILQAAFYNPFLIAAKDVLIYLLTDSGTSAMSSDQWAGIMKGDESYAGSESFFHFEETVRLITGMPIVIPTHQGWPAEKILFSILGGNKKFIISNTLFDTTRANIEFSGAEGIDLLCEEGKHSAIPSPFKGNIDLTALKNFIDEKGAENIPLCIITITNNSGDCKTNWRPRNICRCKKISASSFARRISGANIGSGNLS